MPSSWRRSAGQSAHADPTPPPAPTVPVASRSVVNAIAGDPQTLNSEIDPADRLGHQPRPLGALHFHRLLVNQLDGLGLAVRTGARVDLLHVLERGAEADPLAD